MRCEYCRPHAHPKQNRLCHVGERLFETYREAAEKYSEFSQMPEPPAVATQKAREEMTNARKAFRAHTDGA